MVSAKGCVEESEMRPCSAGKSSFIHGICVFLIQQVPADIFGRDANQRACILPLEKYSVVEETASGRVYACL